MFYLKTYPTFDVLGGLFDMSPAKAQENVIQLLPILKAGRKNAPSFTRIATSNPAT
ncbi:MAG: transposase family protein [Chromatiales bacterium]|nr:transposase family protein [Chromatiales bacterium]